MKARGDTDVFPSSSFLGEYFSLERCELPRRSKLNRHKGVTFFSDEPHHKGLVHLQLSETFKAESGAFTTTIRGTTHNGIGGFPNSYKSVTNTSGEYTKKLGFPKESLAKGPLSK